MILEKLLNARDHLKSQAQIWAQEARTQKGIVLGILRDLGLPLRDWEAESNVRDLVTTLRTDLRDTLTLLRDCKPAVFSWNEYDLYVRVSTHLERLDPQPPNTDPGF